MSAWRTGAGAWAAGFFKRGRAGRRSWGTAPCSWWADPDYYGRYGFQSAVSLGFQNASGVADQFLLARSLDPDGFQEAGGVLNLH